MPANTNFTPQPKNESRRLLVDAKITAERAAAFDRILPEFFSNIVHGAFAPAVFFRIMLILKKTDLFGGIFRQKPGSGHSDRTNADPRIETFPKHPGRRFAQLPRKLRRRA